jgi:hypothetical protein
MFGTELLSYGRPYVPPHLIHLWFTAVTQSIITAHMAGRFCCALIAGNCSNESLYYSSSYDVEMY